MKKSIPGIIRIHDNIASMNQQERDEWLEELAGAQTAHYNQQFNDVFQYFGGLNVKDEEIK